MSQIVKSIEKKIQGCNEFFVLQFSKKIKRLSLYVFFFAAQGDLQKSRDESSSAREGRRKPLTHYFVAFTILLLENEKMLPDEQIPLAGMPIKNPGSRELLHDCRPHRKDG